jgi:hypothetical protein
LTPTPAAHHPHHFEDLSPDDFESKALVRAIEALGTIEPTNHLERRLARLLLYLHKRRLRGIVAAVPAWVSGEILRQASALGT